MMVYNLVKTAQKGHIEDGVVYKAPPMDPNAEPNADKHRKLEGMPFVFTVWALIAILIGSIIEIAPAVLSDNYIEKDSRIQPYTPLELAGRDIYVKEGCYTCHSQQVRPMPDEALRYGQPSTAAESMYDHPYQWGSRRIGPDLARLGKKYPDVWHYRHMMNPRAVVPKSIMPVYTWLFSKKTEYKVLHKKLKVMKALGVPYTDDQIAHAQSLAEAQALKIAQGLASSGVDAQKMKDKQIIALIAYLQRLGTDIKKPKEDK
jgi:cytochrome c oxidase cbb3-type subunit I/II